MNSDDVVWQIINHTHCSFKYRLKCGNLCRNEYNVTGLCNKSSCPLANSRYATIKERDGILYLYLKEPERAAYPSKQWERVKLKANEQQAIEQINKHMRYWDRKMRSKVKRRFDRCRGYLVRMRKMAKGRQKLLEPVVRKRERRELHREEKALRVAKISKTVEMELLERLKKKVCEDEIYNIDKEAFENALDQGEMVSDEEEEEGEEVVYTDASDIEEEEEVEDIEEYEEDESEEEQEAIVVTNPRKKRIKITHEKD